LDNLKIKGIIIMDDKKGKNNRRKSITIRLDDPIFDELHDLKSLGKFKTWEMLIVFFLNEKKALKKFISIKTAIHKSLKTPQQIRFKLKSISEKST
jgi:hypothetical protein